MPLPLALRQLLLLLLLMANSTVTAAELPACLSVLQPSGATPLSLHADNDGTGKTSVLLRYVPPQTRGSSFVAPDLSSPSAEWRVHIYSQHTSVSLPIDLKTTAGSVNDTETKSWKIPIVVERGFRVGTHFLKASLLEFPQGCRNRQGFDEQSASQCDDVRHAEIEAKDRNADKGARRRLICATATRIFDVHLDAKNARIQAKKLDTATEDSRAEMRPRNTQKRRPLRIVFLSGLTNDGQSTHLFQLLPRLLSKPASFRVSVLFPKSSADQLFQSESDPEKPDDRNRGEALDWSLDAASRFNNKRHLIPATDVRLYRRARALLLRRSGNGTTGRLLPYEMRGWTFREFQDAGGLKGVVERLQRVPTGRTDLMAPSDKRSLKTLMTGLRGADVVHYTHIPEQALENQLLVQSARIMGVQRILCEPGRWHDKTLDDTDVNNHITGRGITDVIGPSAASCSNWFPKSARYHQDTVEVDASSYVYSGLGEANTRSHCHVLPIGADVDVNDIGPQKGNSSAEKQRYRVPFAGLQRAADTPAGGGVGSRSRGYRRPTVVIAVIGRLAAIKSPGIIMRAAAFLKQELENRRKLDAIANEGFNGSPLPRFVIEFWGDGPLLDLLAGTLAPELGLSVKLRGSVEKVDKEDKDDDVLVSFEGWVHHETIHSRLQSTVDAVLHSTFEETYCVSNVEALAAGRILLTFGTAGVSEYLQPTDPHGIVVWPPTAASMAATLLEIVDAPETARAMGRAAEKYVVAEGLIRDRTIDRAVQFYHEISEENAAD